MDDLNFANKFNTSLSVADEARFKNWLQQQSAARGRVLANDLVNYDLRGYWKNQGYKDDKSEGHFPDTYKKPNHPTFSDESIYSGIPDANGVKMQGGRWLGDDKTGWSFQPSAYMMNKNDARQKLQQYFADFEPDAKLVMPPDFQRQ